MNDIEFLLTGLFVSTTSLMLFIYLGNEILNFLKPALRQQPIPVKNAPRPIVRRRSEIKPGIVCSLPIHQRGSRETPLY
jgi:hypothetical protein